MKTFDKKFWWIFLPFILLIIIILFLPALFVKYSWLNLNFTNSGNIGDTIGGIMGPFIAIAAAILTFFAFWVQYKANEQQKHDLKIERFENKFYSLLQLHKSNVEEMKISDSISGRKCFVHLFYELRFCYTTSREFYDAITVEEKTEFEYDKIDLMNFSYKIFFFGIGFHSEKHFLNSLKKGDLHLFNQLKPFLLLIQNKYLEHVRDNPNARCFVYDLPMTNIPDYKTIEFYYLPFDGHVNKLSHYYRHLFQAASFIIEQTFISENEKYGYIKMLRAQMPNFEQLLLYYNALAWFDKEWKILFTRYRFIKNLPLPLADFGEIPENHFKNEIEELNNQDIAMFEWHE